MNSVRHLLAWFMPALLMLLAGCAGDRLPAPGPPVKTTLDDISDVQWRRLASRKIYFGPQSVGRNVLEGVRELMAGNLKIRLNIVSSSAPASVAGPALVESSIGTNGDPASKAHAFAANLEHGLGPGGGLAMYKYCYLDTLPTTDPQKMFDDYKENVSAIGAAHPDVTIVHITSPLTTVESTPKYLVKELLGRPTDRELDAKRNRYNELLRKEYGGREPIFDLAQVESTHEDGSRSYFTQDGVTVYTLAPEWTDDGGHLNQAGRHTAAVALLRLLAQLETRN